MTPHPRRSILPLLLGAALCGCQGPQGGTAAPRAGAGTASGGAVRPVPDQSRRDIEQLERERFNQAVQGLDFDTGLVVVVTPARGAPDRAAAMIHYADGLEKLDANRRIDSLTAFTLAARSDPQWPAAYDGLGRALLNKGKDDLGLAAFRTEAALEPGSLDALFNVATTLDRLGRRPEAIEQMLVVVDRDPARAAAHERLAVWYYYEQDFDAAWRHARAAQALGRPLPPQLITLLGQHRPPLDASTE